MNSENTPPEKDRPSDTENNALSERKILAVEDDVFLSNLLSQKLSESGGTLFNAERGEEALRIAQEKNPDVILLDILLPGMDGFEVLKRLKMDEKTKDIPVIILSNLGQKQDIEKGEELGAELFLTKATFTLDEILEKIESVLR